MDEATARRIDEVLETVYHALKEKGYHPEGQILGYLLTDDPTYITPYNHARELLAELDRDDVGIRILTAYFDEKKR